MTSLMVCTLYRMLSDEQINEDEIGGTCSTLGGRMRHAYIILTCKSEESRSLARPRPR
jgi:hypothetical protein